MIHWLDVRIDCSSITDLKNAFTYALNGVEFITNNAGWLVHPTGLRIWKKYGFWHVLATGQTCENLEAYGGVLQVFARSRAIWLEGVEFYDDENDCLRPEIITPPGEYLVYRLDFAWDKIDIEPKELLDRYKTNWGWNMQSCLRESSWSWAEDSKGQTCYLGSRESDRMLRLYNQRGYNRLELQLRGRFCKFLSKYLEIELESDFEQEIIKSVTGILRDMIDFLDWDKWQDFLKGFDRVRVRCDNVGTSIERKTRWIMRQCGSTLAVLSNVLPDFLGIVIQDFQRKDFVQNLIRDAIWQIEQLKPDPFGFVPWGQFLTLDKILPSVVECNYSERSDENAYSQKQESRSYESLYDEFPTGSKFPAVGRQGF